MVARRLCASPARCPQMMFLPLVLLLSLIALLPVEALKCYDCLSKSFPECRDSTKEKNFDQTDCHKDEKYCSTLVLKDTAGDEILTRQCSSSPNESQQLKNFVRGSHDRDLRVVHFEVCRTDLCNTYPRPVVTGSNSALPFTFHSMGLRLALATVAVLRLSV